MKIRIIAMCIVGLLMACNRAATEPKLVSLDTGQAGQHDQPVFSPDGKRLAFTRREQDEEGVWVSDSDGKNAKLVSQLAQQMGDPAWSPDGSSLVYVVDGAGLWTVTVDSGKPVQLMTDDATGPQYSPDGSRIVCTSVVDGRPALITIGKSGGPATILPFGSMPGGRPLPGGRVRWSPDGSRIAFTARSGVVAVLDVAGGVVTPLTDEGAENFMEWSPDGRAVLYVSRRTGQADIWVVPATGGAARQLTHDVRDDQAPRYSPDGKWIAYNSQRGGQQDVWVVRDSGGLSLRVTSDRAVAGGPNWARDGNSLVFVNYDAVRQVFAAPTAGGTLRQLTTADQASYDPDISPDGKTLVYAGIRDPLSGIYMLPIDGGVEKPLASGPGNVFPQWSPNGEMVAYMSNVDDRPSVWVVSIADGKEWRVSPVGRVSVTPFWSPDGTRILYRTDSAGPVNVLMTVAARGGEPKRVTDVVGNSTRWSADGANIVFRHGNPRDNPGIYRAPSSGGKAVLLTQGQPLAASPAWSHNGRWIAYSAPTPDGASDIFVMDADGSGRRRLVDSPAQEFDPVWSADDSEVFFTTGYFGVSAVSLATGAVRSVFRGDLRLDGSPTFSLDRSMVVVTAFRNANVLVRVDVRGLLRGK